LDSREKNRRVQRFGKGKKGVNCGLAGREQWDAPELHARQFG